MTTASAAASVKDVKPPTIYPGVDKIRQVQELALFAALLPADGKLRELLELALALDANRLAPRVKPVADLHPHTMKAYFESFCPSQTPEEKALITWQSNVNSENIATAMRELAAVEELTGIKLTAVPA